MQLSQLFVVLAFASPVCGAIGAEALDKPLENFVASLKLHPAKPDTPLTLSAVGLVKNGHLYLSFRLKNISTAPIAMAKPDLPWGHVYSTRFVVLTLQGQILPVSYPIDDVFVPPSVSIVPGETLRGDYDLSSMLHLEAIPADSDLVVLWSYRGSVERSGTPKFDGLTGVAVLHTPTKPGGRPN